ncbi:MAG: aspartate/glutamate racemase family protein [Halanaerobiales bacterium]
MNNRKEKVIGILGGMGPLATSHFYSLIIRYTSVTEDQEHIHVIIDSNPAIPDRTAAILKNGENPLPLLIKTAQNLENAGADLITIPCNTAHYFVDDIQKSISLPIINMIKETVDWLRDHSEKQKIGLLATTGTIQTGLYNKYFANSDIELIYPDENEQKIIMEIIYSIKKGKQLSISYKEELSEIISKLYSKEICSVVTGCTELSMIADSIDSPVTIIDPLDILAKNIVRLIKGVRVENVCEQ